MGSKFVTTIDRSGPFFRVDPAKTFRENIKVFTAAVAAEGEADVKVQLQAGEGGRLPLGGAIRPGRVSAHVIGRTHALNGKQWAATAIISVTNAGLDARQAIKIQAADSWLESQGHAFRRTTGRLRRAQAINRVELLKGLK